MRVRGKDQYRLFFSDSSETGSLRTAIQCFQLIIAKAFALGTIE